MTQNKAMPKEHEVELVSSPGVQDSEVEVYEAIDGSEVPKELSDILEADDNLADEYGTEELYEQIQQRVMEDEESMEPYKKRYDRALKLARMVAEDGDKTFPFVGASRIMASLLIEASLDFWARSFPIVVERKNIAQAEIYGGKTDDKIAKADRVADFVNYDLRKGISNWRDDQSKALLQLSITGTYYKKTWHDPSSGKRKSQLLQADDLICDHTKSSFNDCQFKSYRYLMSRSQIASAIVTGIFVDFDYGQDNADEQNDLEFLESHCWLDLDDDGISEPYIAILCESKNEIVSLVRRFDIDDVTVTEDNEVVSIDAEDQFTITTFIPDPSLSFLGMGWGILMGDSFETINTTIRQLLDAGTLQNTAGNSGFISIGRNGPKGRTRKGKQSLIMGQFTGVEMDNIGQNIWQPSFAGPSPTLFSLMEKLTEDLRSTISTGQQTEANPGEAAELYLSRLQQGLKLPTAIMVNVYNGITRELGRLQEIYTDYLTDEEYQVITGDQEASVDADFGMPDLDLQLTADPTQGSEEERIAKAKIVLDEAKQNPGHDIRKAYSDYYTAIGVSDIEEIIPPPQPQQPDPLIEIQNKIAEAEQKSAKAAEISAIAKILTAQSQLAKTEAEIGKIRSETIKNLSDVKATEMESKLKVLESNMKAARGLIEDELRIFETDTRANAAMAGDATGQSTQGSAEPAV